LNIRIKVFTVQVLSFLSDFIAASVFATLTWLFADALAIRIEPKTLFKTLTFALLTIAQALSLAQLFSSISLPQIVFWLQSIGLWLLFVAFILDSHSKLQFLAILAIVFLFLFRDHLLLAIQAALIAITVLQIAHTTKHNDLIPFGVGFVLIACAEFFYFLQRTKNFEEIALAGDFLYVFASIALFYWLWQYLVIRFNLGKK